MGIRSVLAVAFAATALSACALVDPVDSRYDTIGRSLAKARNDAIFLNLVRASHSDPLNFLTIANVSPSMSNTTAFALPSFSEGPPNCFAGACGYAMGIPGHAFGFGNNTASNNTAVSSNFSIATQETSGFYTGFLKPVDLEVVDYFVRQNYSRELLFWLFVDSVEIDLPGRQLISRYDPPKDYGCNPKEKDPKARCFADFVLIAIGAGLTIEEKTIIQPGNAKDDNSNNNTAGQAGSKAKTTVLSRLCFNRVLGEHAQREMTLSGRPWSEIQTRYLDLRESEFRPRCGDPWDLGKQENGPQPDYFPFRVGPVQFKIIPRSAFGVFEFLGSVMKMQEQGLVPDPGVYIPRPGEAAPPKLWTTRDDENLITVLRDQNADCFVYTWYRGANYCVPYRADTTKNIFSLLAQLIAIQTAATDLSITPVVRVIQ